MVEKFESYIKDQQLIHNKEKILLAVSGGIDSMCMSELFRLSNYQIGIAHLNHKMRGNASDLDEELCKSFAADHDIPFYCKQIDLSMVTSNFQAKARAIRYEWLAEIALKNDYQLIATAHHKDDQIENFFLRINRRSGLNGLSGIKARSGKIIRPLLFANKNEIGKFVYEKEIPYREDKSNSESKYDRNFFRNDILPEIESRFPEFSNDLHSTIGKLTEANNLLHTYIEQRKKKLVKHEINETTIYIKKLQKHPQGEFVLYLILGPFGLNRTQSDNLFNAKTGGFVRVKNTICVKDRKKIIIRNQIAEKIQDIEISNKPNTYQLTTGFLLVQKAMPIQKLNRNNYLVYIDTEKVAFPLKIRKRRDGDVFFPSGMNMQKKKLKKFLIDQKLNKFQKEDLNLLVDKTDQIVWVMGMRLDERFKTTPTSSKIIEMQIIFK